MHKFRVVASNTHSQFCLERTPHESSYFRILAGIVLASVVITTFDLELRRYTYTTAGVETGSSWGVSINPPGWSEPYGDHYSFGRKTTGGETVWTATSPAIRLVVWGEPPNKTSMKTPPPRIVDCPPGAEVVSNHAFFCEPNNSGLDGDDRDEPSSGQGDRG